MKSFNFRPFINFSSRETEEETRKYYTNSVDSLKAVICNIDIRCWATKTYIILVK